jgi:hypothetical protein
VIVASQAFGRYAIRRHLRRRAAIEHEIGHMKSDGLLGRSFLKGMEGDAINALLCGAGHNLRKILARLRALLRLLMGAPRKVVQGLLVRLEAGGILQPALTAA